VKKPCLRRECGTSEKRSLKNGCSGLCGGSAPLRSPSDGGDASRRAKRGRNEHDQKIGAPIRVDGARGISSYGVWGLRELIGSITGANRLYSPRLERKDPGRCSKPKTSVR
jgi:hypothetical protein